MAAFFALALLLAFALAMRSKPVPQSPHPTESRDLSAEQAAAAARALEAFLAREFPLHGLVTKTQLVIRQTASSEAVSIGVLRMGARVRAKRENVTAVNCQSGFYAIHPRGWVCAGQGVEFSATAPTAAGTLQNETGAPFVDRALPYRYLFVKEEQVPEFHLPPSREDQRAADAHSQRYLEFVRAGDTARAERLRTQGLPGEPPKPPEVARYLDHGFFVASNGVEVRSRRRFSHTVRGTYIRESQLEERTGSEFHGVVLDANTTLPVAWTVRVARYLDGNETGMRETEEPRLEAHQRLRWQERVRIGAQFYHRVETDHGIRYLRDWLASVATLHAPPRAVGAEEPWVHVNVRAQTLVLYRGATPVYATLVSSGVAGHDTPLGEFRIRRKFVTDTMADLGPEAGDDRYRIEDVPWTQYFDGSIALHAAFWHNQFGQRKSHGCVNLAPEDARYIFSHTWPEVPHGWHGVVNEGGRDQALQGSVVLVTDD